MYLIAQKLNMLYQLPVIISVISNWREMNDLGATSKSF